MIITKHYCDKCKKEVKDTNQFWNVGVIAKFHKHPISEKNHVDAAHLQMHVCRTCLFALGIHLRHVPGPAPQPEPPKLEDIIAEIAANAAQDVLANQ